MNMDEIRAFETPFGVVTVCHEASGSQISFLHAAEKYTFMNGVTADLHYLFIDSRNYAVGDLLQIRIGSLDELECYSSDENTIMAEYHDDKTCFAVIGTATDYDETNHEFFTGRTFSFTEYPSERGMDYKIIHDPNDGSLYETMIRTLIVWLPLSDQYNAADLISSELV